MNRQLTREEIQKILQRWHQLRNQYGEQAVSVPEFAQLSKIIKYLQQNQLQRQLQQQQQQGAQGNGQSPVQQPLSQPPHGPPQANGNVQQFPVQPHNSMAGSMMGSSNQGTPNVQNANLMGSGPNNMVMGAQAPNNQIPNRQNAPPVPNQAAQQLMFQQNNGTANGNGTIPVPRNQAGANSQESAFTAQQFQLVKSQFQALKYLLKNPGPGTPQIPQNLIEFVTTERSAFPNGPYLPSLEQSQPGQPQAPSAQQTPSMGSQQNINLSQQAQGKMMNTAPVGTGPITPSYDSNGKNLNKGSKSTPLQSHESMKQPVKPIESIQQGQSPSISQQAAVDTTSLAKTFRAVLYKPEPPRSLDKLIPDKSANKTVAVLPISKANVQVDTFELPNILRESDKQIAFQALYAPQSRLQWPSLSPEGINMDDIVTNKEVLMMIQMDEELTQLRNRLNSMDETDEQREKIEAQIIKLELAPFQKQLRGKILSQVWFSKSLLPNSHPNFLAKFNTLSLENVSATHDLYTHQLQTLVQAENQKHQKTINQILLSRERRFNITTKKKEKLNRLNTKINSFHNQTAREEQKRIEKMAKQRLQALKSNDEEAYLKLLDHTKDTRITHLLKQTNQFLDSLAQAVQSQQKESSEKSKTGRNVKEDSPEVNDDEKREKMDYYHVAHRIKEEVHKQPSILVGGTLKEYQLKGLQWMVSLFNNHLNGILADEMGLGKTIQTISLITYLVEVKQISGPFLVIVPLSTLTNWNLEFEKWAPAVKKITYKGTPNQRKIMQQDIRMGNFQILLTTFEYIIKDKALLSRVKWVHMIIDEGHRMKNANSKLSETLTHSYHSDYRLILTGTPLQNNLPELWALLNFVLPKIFNSVKSFDEWFNTPFSNTGGQDKIELSEEETLLVIRRLHKVLRPFLLRRLKKDVEKDLPNKVEKVVKCKMSALQSKLYQQMLKHNILFASETLTSTEPIMIKNANNQIMQLRKICNHPFVYEEVENLINPTVETNDIIWRVAGKFELLDKILPKFKLTGHRVLIFFQMTQIMDIMEDFLRLRGMKYMRLDGGTKADDRTSLLKLFNAPDSEYFCFLLSTRAGGLGLNLQTADTVIIFDTDWNPHQDLQAQDRAHRIGQKNEVRILRLITEDSIEEMILERAHAKLEIDGKVIQAGKFDNKSTSEEQEAMLRALLDKEEERKHKGSGSDDEDLDDDELNRVIARNEAELETFRRLDEERAVATREAAYPSRLFADSELPYVYKQNPEDFLKKDIVLEDYGRGNRERKTMSYDDNLTEEQWLKKIDGVVSDASDDEGELKPKRKRIRPKKKAVEDEQFSQDEDFESNPSGKRSADREDLVEPSSKRQKSATPKSQASKAKPRNRKGRGARSILYRSTPTIDPLLPEERTNLQEVIEGIFNLIMSYQNEHGRTLSDLFLVKPSRKLYPDYYVLIKNPIALDTVKKRMNSNTYTSIREALEDLHLMFTNAKIYNEEGSIVYQDAAALEQMAFDRFKELTSDLTEEEKNKLIDFADFDEALGLKPLAVNSAVKRPVENHLARLDNGEELDSSLLGLTSNADTENTTRTGP
ncbi:uncharacterized protein CANTADRAFT_91528 [Suhomyces tanzawaensis NRRL Y-17324]|uniref:Uncharacterized protein n=1 Tax=Suhomyces tanzawaensis NRRL Y-17324 TaxID=984487 RepID=A0A1E4SF43_9ASCO|nr:uncharacterized protein CANTADRAFT_91528 [Suhomyces tanzawaensis NRRL Y-17324]ODV78096.1 hypothetical protein CANTADRAFT_91528 [Suhomyces tanzawaensis NRRL Y-17324]